MTLVKKQHNGRELPVFENMDEATEYFARRRKTIYKGINALLMVFGLILGIIVALFHPSLVSTLLSLIGLAAGSLYCIIEEPKIRAPEQFMVFYSKEEGKWLLFPADKYPAVAFVLEYPHLPQQSNPLNCGANFLGSLRLYFADKTVVQLNPNLSRFSATSRLVDDNFID